MTYVRVVVLALVATFAGALAGGVLAQIDGPLERAAIDTRFAVRGGHAPDDRIVLVALDNRTLRTLGERPPLPRSIHAELVDRLDVAGAAVIAFDFALEQSSGDEAADQALAAALMNARRSVVSVTAPGPGGDVADLAGFVAFADTDVRPGFTGLRVDPDGAVRRMSQSFSGVAPFAPAAAGALTGREIAVPDNALVDFPGPTGTFPTLSYLDVLEGRFAPAAVKGRIVVIGPTATVIDDTHRAAVASAMPGAEIHAAAIATALNGFPLRRGAAGPPALYALGVVLLITGMGFLARAWRGRRAAGVPLVAPSPLAAAALGGLALAAWLLAVQVAFERGRVVEVVPPAAAIVMAAAVMAGGGALARARERRQVRALFVAERPGVLERVLAGRGGRHAVGATDIVAGYRLDGRLGTGGMGVVFQATQLRLDRAVALKLIRDEHARDPGHRRRFVAEAHRAAALFHPNIVPVLDAGDDDGVLYIAMPLVSGTDLGASALDVRGRGPAHVTRVMHRVACALDAAHREAIVHRDVKPANILIPRASPEHPMLTDFGLASTSGEPSRGREGTLAYLAPEGWDGAGATAAADIYALAAVTFEVLTGQRAFAGTRAAHHDPVRPAVTAVRPELPVEIDAVLERGFAVDPAERPPTATTLTRAVAEVLGVELSDDQAPASHRPPPVPDGLSMTLTETQGV